MLWFVIHNIAKMFSLENQTRNLAVFLTGVVLYVLFYAYVGSLDLTNPFYIRLFSYFIYIILADGFAMAILYKNGYKQSILMEVNETFGATGPKMTANDVEPILDADALVQKNDVLDDVLDDVEPEIN